MQQWFRLRMFLQEGLPQVARHRHDGLDAWPHEFSFLQLFEQQVPWADAMDEGFPSVVVEGSCVEGRHMMRPLSFMTVHDAVGRWVGKQPTINFGRKTIV